MKIASNSNLELIKALPGYSYIIKTLSRRLGIDAHKLVAGCILLLGVVRQVMSFRSLARSLVERYLMSSIWVEAGSEAEKMLVHWLVAHRGMKAKSRTLQILCSTQKRRTMDDDDDEIDEGEKDEGSQQAKSNVMFTPAESTFSFTYRRRPFHVSFDKHSTCRAKAPPAKRNERPSRKCLVWGGRPRRSKLSSRKLKLITTPRRHR